MKEKIFNPNRDWHRLLISWFAGVIIVFALAILFYLFLFNEQFSSQQQNVTNSQNNFFNRHDFDRVVEMIKTRAENFESLQSAPTGLVDPSL